MSDPLLDAGASALSANSGRRDVLQLLLKAKAESDRRNYPAKHAILRDLIRERPMEFETDSEDGFAYGLTHSPTGFKIHLPRHAVPDGFIPRKAIKYASLESEEWDVLAPLDELIEKHGDIILALKRAAAFLQAPGDPDYDLSYDARRGATRLVSPSHEKLARLWDVLQEIAPLEHRALPLTKAPDDEIIHIKRAYSPTAKGVTDAVGLTEGPANEWYGGPRPLASMLLGGAAGAALGYTGGAVADSISGGHLQKRRLRKLLALMGGAAGAAPGAAWGWHELSKSGCSGWLAPDATPVGAARALRALLPRVSLREGFAKQSDDDSGGLFATPAFAAPIPVSGFNEVIWSASDPFTPPSLRASAAGLIQTASLSRGGSSIVTPFDIARIGVGMGTGAASGWLAGKTLGVLAGLSPEAQQGLQRAGIWAGALRAVVPPLFGG